VACACSSVCPAAIARATASRERLAITDVGCNIGLFARLSVAQDEVFEIHGFHGLASGFSESPLHPIALHRLDGFHKHHLHIDTLDVDQL
jgi:hypothetical protein